MGIAHSPFPSEASGLPGIVAGSISNVRQNDVLAAMTFWSLERKSSGWLDETTTARELAASKWMIGAFDMEMALEGRKLAGVRALASAETSLDANPQADVLGQGIIPGLNRHYT
ncbi:hypothetical protein GR138_26150 [Shinella kummerowiae]|uniref:Uncharacterized protein n=1 Tax=Shinella kummerowiae TaxID=417745 RepID=A0A6N8SP39_9HYPH|nr:hypothetical protein [Shinella kummerowiae]